MKNRIYIICVAFIMALVPQKGHSQNAEVVRMMDYLVLAEQAGLNVPVYLMELADQLALVSASQYMDNEILEQGEAAARLYAHPLVCMNYAACLMKQMRFGDALRYLAVAWHQDKQNHMLATNIARCHFELGDNALAEAFLQRALQLEPNYGLALQLKATILLSKGDGGSQEEAVGYVMRSALDVWNHVSVKHFNSLAGVLEKMYYQYRDAIHNTEYYDKVVTLKTPLDDHADLFVEIAQAGQEKKPELTLWSFTYPVPVRDLEYDERYIMSLWKGANSPSIVDMVMNDFMQRTLEIQIPTKSHDYPVEYTGMLGGNEYIPDSRAFNVGMVAYFYHQIKILEAKHNLEAKQGELLKPVEEATGKAMEGVEERMLKANERGELINPYVLKGYGEEIYAIGQRYIQTAIRTRIECYDEFLYPVLTQYQKDIKTALFYVANKEAFKYLQTHYDYDVAKTYEQDETYYFANLQLGTDASHMLATNAEDMIRLINRDRDNENPLKRLRRWINNEELKAAGMENIGKYPAPELSAKIGGRRLSVSVDAANRIITRVETPDKVEINVYNPNTGASSSTVLTPVTVTSVGGNLAQGRAPHGNMPAGFQDKVDLSGAAPPSLGNVKIMQGSQLVKDARGNIIASNRVTEMTRVASTSDNLYSQLKSTPKIMSWKDFISPSATIYSRTTQTRRIGSSTVSTTSRSSASFNMDVGAAGLTAFSIGVGF